MPPVAGHDADAEAIADMLLRFFNQVIRCGSTKQEQGKFNKLDEYGLVHWLLPDPALAGGDSTTPARDICGLHIDRWSRRSIGM